VKSSLSLEVEMCEYRVSFRRALAALYDTLFRQDLAPDTRDVVTRLGAVILQFRPADERESEHRARKQQSLIHVQYLFHLLLNMSTSTGTGWASLRQQARSLESQVLQCVLNCQGELLLTGCL
jgi:hypothetical protein